jgi:putative sugar O-methyltransferase
MQENIASSKSIKKVIEYAQTIGFDHRGDFDTQREKILLMRHCLYNDYPAFRMDIDSLCESEYSIHKSIGKLRGQLVSDMLFFHMFYMLSCHKYNTNISTVCEIGGGYGNPARLWMLNQIHKIRNYTLIDLPESLFYAEVFLSVALPGYKIVYCHNPSDLGNAIDTVYLVPVHLTQLIRNANFDLVINTGSLAELSQDWVTYWSDWISKQEIDTFYSHNYFGIASDQIHESRNLIAPIRPNGFKVAQVRMNAPLMTITSTNRDAAELIFQRNASLEENIYRLMMIKIDDKWSLVDLAYYCFNLNCKVSNDSFYDEVVILKKFLIDLGFFPKELIFLLERINLNLLFSTLNRNDIEHLSQVYDSISKAYRENFPIGK